MELVEEVEMEAEMDLECREEVDHGWEMVYEELDVQSGAVVLQVEL